jgi:hypothetical protein
MRLPAFTLAVLRTDQRLGALGQPVIPTLGNIATAFDAYKAVGIVDVGNRPLSWCFTDTSAAAALGRIVEGPIHSVSDISSAEEALRAILLYDFVEILVPCAKAKYDSGIIGYHRFDKKERNEAAFAATRVAPCRDLLYASEFISISREEIVESTNLDSKVVGRSSCDDSLAYGLITESCADLANALPMTIGAAAHFASNALQKPLRPGVGGFINQLYSRINKPWMEVAQSQPHLYCELKLPPLLAICLNRASHRADLPGVLGELRQELADARIELNSMNEMLESSNSQAEIVRQSKRIQQCFDAIVPEALMTNTQRKQRRIMSVFRILKPIPQLYSAAVDPLSLGPSQFADVFDSVQATILNEGRIVSRCSSALKFSSLLRTGSIRDVMTSHFNDDELRLLC